MATAAATTSSSSSSSSSAATTSSSYSSQRWFSQSSRNFGERALPPPPRTLTPPPSATPEHEERLKKLLDRALPTPPRGSTPPPPPVPKHGTDYQHENIYEEITDDFIQRALQRNRNRNKMAQKSVPNREDDYGFVCQNPDVMDSSAQRRVNQTLWSAAGAEANPGAHIPQGMEDNMIIPPDAKYNPQRSSTRTVPQSGVPSVNQVHQSAFGFPRSCANPQPTNMSLPQQSEIEARLRDCPDMQSLRDHSEYPPPPSYSQSQAPMQNFLPHCHPMPAQLPQQSVCMSSASHMCQSSSSSLMSSQYSFNHSQTSLNSVQLQQYMHQQSLVQNPPLPPKNLQPPPPPPKYPSQAPPPPPPSYPGLQPALPPRQQPSVAQAGQVHPLPPEYQSHQSQYKAPPAYPQHLQSNIYPPDYPSNLLSSSQANVTLSSNQLASSSSLMSSSCSTLSSQGQLFYTPGVTQANPVQLRPRPCHAPTDTDPTWCPYSSRPPSSLYLSDSSGPYNAGSDSGISVCSERGYPFAASVLPNQVHPDHQRARTDLDCNALANRLAQIDQNGRRHSVNLNESKCSDQYLVPNCVHPADEGFSELHCYHQHQLHQQQLKQQHMQQQLQQQQAQQQQMYEQRLQQQQLQEQQLYEHQLKLKQQQEQQRKEELNFLYQQQLQQQDQSEQLELQQRQQRQQIQQQLQEESNFVQRAREKIYQKLKHLDLAHPDHNQLEFSPVPWSPPPSECANAADPVPPPLPPPREPQVFKSISLSKGLQHLDPNGLTPSRDDPPPLPARLKRAHLSRKPLPVVPQEKDEEEEEVVRKNSGAFESVKPVEYKGDDIIGITAGLDRLPVFHRQQGARKVIPRAHSTDTESEYGSRANSRDVRSSAKDKRASSKTKSKDARNKSKDSRSISKDTRESAREATRARSAERRSQSRRRRAKSLDKRTTSENRKEKAALSSSNEGPPLPPPLKARHSSGSSKTAGRPPPLSVRNVSDSSSSAYEDRSPGILNGTLSDLLRRNHDRQLLV